MSEEQESYEVLQAGSYKGKWYTRRNAHEIHELPASVKAKWLREGRIRLRRGARPSGEWALSYSPAEYLERWPTGQHAEEARARLAAEPAEPETGDEEA